MQERDATPCTAKARQWMRTLIRQALYSGFVASCNGGQFMDGGDTGRLSLLVTDAPVDDASEVVVDFAGIELEPEDGDPVRLDIEPDRAVDLLALRGGATLAILSNRSVPAGRYERVRLIVNARPDVQDDSFIQLVTGERFPLVIQDGDEAGLTVNVPFTVDGDGRVDLVADFDLRRSVIAPPGGLGPNYFFRPALRIVDSREAGAIAGEIDPLRVHAACTPFVYVFEGTAVQPDDMDFAAGVEPFTSVAATPDGVSGRFAYRISFLEPGEYTVSFTCDGEVDNPDVNDLVRFEATANATVDADQTTIVDF